MDTARHTRRRRPRGVARVAALVAVALVVTGASAAGAVWWRLEHNIQHLDTAGLLGDDRPSTTPTATDPADPHAGTPVNLLLVGSDDRSGENAEIGGAVDGMRSDTTLVAHISADRSRVVLVSIPRDSDVAIPSCTMTDGSTTKAQTLTKFNEAFSIGWNHGHDLASAVGCTMKTVEQLTGVRLDGVLVADFSGFEQMVDAVGGVPFCFPEALDDEDSGLHVAAGPRVLDGRTALQFARARHDIGDGSDLSRIHRQHEFLAAMVREVMQRNVLADAPSLLRFADAATRSLSASNGFDSLTGLAGLGRSLRHIGLDGVVFVMVPVVDSTVHSGRVVWTQEATTLWQRIAADQPVGPAVETPVTPSSTPAATPGATAPPAAPPADTWEPRSGVATSADAGVSTDGACA